MNANRRKSVRRNRQSPLRHSGTQSHLGLSPWPGCVSLFRQNRPTPGSGHFEKYGFRL